MPDEREQQLLDEIRETQKAILNAKEKIRRLSDELEQIRNSQKDIQTAKENIRKIIDEQERPKRNNPSVTWASEDTPDIENPKTKAYVERLQKKGTPVGLADNNTLIAEYGKTKYTDMTSTTYLIDTADRGTYILTAYEHHDGTYNGAIYQTDQKTAALMRSNMRMDGTLTIVPFADDDEPMTKAIPKNVLERRREVDERISDTTNRNQSVINIDYADNVEDVINKAINYVQAIVPLTEIETPRNTNLLLHSYSEMTRMTKDLSAEQYVYLLDQGRESRAIEIVRHHDDPTGKDVTLATVTPLDPLRFEDVQILGGMKDEIFRNGTYDLNQASDKSHEDYQDTLQQLHNRNEVTHVYEEPVNRILELIVETSAIDTTVPGVNQIKKEVPLYIPEP